MYSRRQGDTTYTFEPSGGLLNSSLVMMDRETDSHWSIITEEAIWGPSKGQRLEQIPGAVRTTWGEWRRDYPDTLVLSINGKEHVEKDPYVDYFSSEEGFAKLVAEDRRFRDKELIYAFLWQDTPFAVPHRAITDGNVVELGERQLFLYRREGEPNYRSTLALLAEPGTEFVRRDNAWETSRGSRFDPQRQEFIGGDASGIRPFTGLDTYWYIWSLTHAQTAVLEPSS